MVIPGRLLFRQTDKGSGPGEGHEKNAAKLPPTTFGSYLAFLQNFWVWGQIRMKTKKTLKKTIPFSLFSGGNHMHTPAHYILVHFLRVFSGLVLVSTSILFVNHTHRCLSRITPEMWCQITNLANLYPYRSRAVKYKTSFHGGHF